MCSKSYIYDSLRFACEIWNPNIWHKNTEIQFNGFRFTFFNLIVKSLFRFNQKRTLSRCGLSEFNWNWSGLPESEAKRETDEKENSTNKFDSKVDAQLSPCANVRCHNTCYSDPLTVKYRMPTKCDCVLNFYEHEHAHMKWCVLCCVSNQSYSNIFIHCVCVYFFIRLLVQSLFLSQSNGIDGNGKMVTVKYKWQTSTKISSPKPIKLMK